MLEVEPRGFVPEVFEVVPLAGFFGEDVEYAVKVVEHGPADVPGTVRVDRQQRMIVLEAQVDLLGDSVGTDLVHTAYHEAAQGYGGAGILIEREEDLLPCLREAQAIARQGRPVLVNILIGRTDFRKGSISM